MSKVKSPTDPVKFLYTNHRGVAAIRSVKFGTLKFGASQWHPEFQFFLRGWDVDKGAVRDFALKDCDFTITNIDEYNRQVDERINAVLVGKGYVLPSEVTDNPFHPESPEGKAYDEQE